MGIKIAQLLVQNSLRVRRAGFRVEDAADTSPPITPILCLCYTNHALDQFLESLVEAGMSNVVRVGSKCKRESLASINLSSLRQNTMGRTEKKMRWERIQGLKSREPVIKKLSASLCGRDISYFDAESFLQETHPELLRSLLGMDPNVAHDSDSEDEWLHDFNGEDSFSAWLKGKCFNPLCRLHALQQVEAKKPKQKSESKKVKNAFSALSLKENSEIDRHHLVTLLQQIAAAGQLKFKDGLPYSSLIQVVMAEFSEDSLEECLESLGVYSLKDLLEDGRTVGVQFVPKQDLSEAQLDRVTYQCKSPLEPFGILAVQDIPSPHTGSPPLRAGEVCVCVEYGEKILRIARLQDTTQNGLRMTIDEYSNTLFCPMHETGRSLEQILQLAVHDMWALSFDERNFFKNYIYENVKEDLIRQLSGEWRKTANDIKDLKAVEESTDLAILKRATIVGMTTTGAANLQAVIRALGPKIVIIEEAAEVLEAHVLANLSPQTQHVIMIGDHQQLRPKTALYQLAVESKKQYNLDVSMFERLVRSFDFKTHTLSHQRRMRPCVSALIGSIYPQLKDHEKVLEYPDVKGTNANVFFFDHNHPEDGDNNDESSSKINEFEAQMVVAFARYLLLQGYGPEDITILTPYLGQLKRLRTLMSKTTLVFVDERDEEDLLMLAGQEAETELEEERFAQEQKQSNFSVDAIGNRLRLATIDNFQGEESTIVLISLVRNNQRGAIGFLKTSNRINVLLSRAKHGMFLFGHSPSLVKDKSSRMWPQVLEVLQSKAQFGVGLPLKCKNHPNTITEITSPEQFDQFVGDGGCSLRCAFRLSCGHQCPRRCHPDDVLHVASYCPMPCSRLRSAEDCPYQHPCPLLCGDSCGPCKVPITSVLLPCGHSARNVACHQANKPADIFCTRKVSFDMKGCGHTLEISCGEVQ